MENNIRQWRKIKFCLNFTSVFLLNMSEFQLISMVPEEDPWIQELTFPLGKSPAPLFALKVVVSYESKDTNTQTKGWLSKPGKYRAS